MTRFIFVVLIFFVASISTTYSVEFCQDTTSQCQHLTHLCNETIMQTECKLSCGICPQDPCNQKSNGGCEDICNWSNGTVTCSCQPGFKPSPTNKRACVDIDECTEGPNPCPAAQGVYCINAVGSYSCQSSNCAVMDPTQMNYYRSSKCCPLKNDTCGMTATIKRALKDLVSPPKHRIFGGFGSSLTAWPWMAQIIEVGRHACGGTLLTKDWVLTTSFCVSGSSYKNMKVFLGHVRNAQLSVIAPLSAQRVERGIERVIRHSVLGLGRLALVKLSAPVPFNDAISPACLPCGDKPDDGETCWATGFGVLNEANPSFSTTLQEVDLPVVNIGKCIRAFRASNTFIDRKTMMCAGYKAGGKDTCLGDGGGPLVCQRKDSCSWYLAGVTAFGKGCGKAGYFGVYTNVLLHEQWIRRALGNDSSELCTSDYNPCRGLVDTASKCDGNATACQDRHKGDCALTCCLRRTGRKSDCFDTPLYKEACEIFVDKCGASDLTMFMQQHCRKTCAFC